MLDFNSLTLFLYIVMRMSGFVLMSPLLGRSTFPGLYKAGFVLVLSVATHSAYQAGAVMPRTALEFAVKLLLEFSVGAAFTVIMQFFFYIPEQAGEIVDTQMGMSMARTYDAGSQSSMTSTATLLNMLAILLFFAANGHITLLRILVTSGEIVPYGAAAMGDAVANRVVELYAECALLAIKLSLPILATELMGQVGMGILMKVIPQINVFAINIELKVIIGLAMLLLMLAPFSEYLLSVESQMLHALEEVLALMG